MRKFFLNLLFFFLVNSESSAQPKHRDSIQNKINCFDSLVSKIDSTQHETDLQIQGSSRSFGLYSAIVYRDFHTDESNKIKLFIGVPKREVIFYYSVDSLLVLKEVVRPYYLVGNKFYDKNQIIESSLTKLAEIQDYLTIYKTIVSHIRNQILQDED